MNPTHNEDPRRRFIHEAEERFPLRIVIRAPTGGFAHSWLAGNGKMFRRTKALNADEVRDAVRIDLGDDARGTVGHLVSIERDAGDAAAFRE